MAAEEFGQNGTFKTPIVESTGTGGGFKLFCEGAGEATPDINDASRTMAESEKQLCLKNGVSDIAGKSKSILHRAREHVGQTKVSYPPSSNCCGEQNLYGRSSNESKVPS